MKSSKHWFLEVRPWRVVVLAVALAFPLAGAAQEKQPAAVAPAAVTQAAAGQTASERVTINVTNGNMADVLNAFARQTGRSMVVGREVTNAVTIRLNDTPWEEALEIMLPPYGYGYQVVGSTIVVNTMTNLTEDLVTEVFNLKFLSATSVYDIVSANLSSNTLRRGAVKILSTQQEGGWQFQTSRDSSDSSVRSGAGVGTKRERVQEGGKREKSKTLLVTDTPKVIEKIRKILAQIDRLPTQVLIEARFVEVKSDFLRDVGMEWGTGADGATPQTFGSGGNVFGIGGQQTGGDVQPAAFSAASGSSLNNAAPFNAGATILFQQLTDFQFSLLLHALEEDASANILSSPRVLTMDSQEASITVGTKYPIIESNVSGGGGSGSTITTTLGYYENIGIQLNCVPQVCADGYINMIVHPAVTEQIGTEGGIVVTAGSQEVPLTRYPVLSVREAETRIMLRSGSTVVIGGLLKKRDASTKLKVPFLGSLPLLGWLFRRDTADEEKLDLLIFLTATIMPSTEQQQKELDEISQARKETKRMMDRAAAAQAQASQAMDVEKAARLKAEERVQSEQAARRAAERKVDDARKEKEELRKKHDAEEAQRAAVEKAEAEAAKERVAEEKREKARQVAEQKARADADARAAAERQAQARQTREAERLRLAAEEKVREEAAAKLEAARIAEAAAAREAESARMAEEARKAAEARQAEKARLAAEKKASAEAAKLATAEQKAQAEAALAAEEQRLQEARKAEAAKKLADEQQRFAERRAALEANAREQSRSAAAGDAAAESEAKSLIQKLADLPANSADRAAGAN